MNEYSVDVIGWMAAVLLVGLVVQGAYLVTTGTYTIGDVARIVGKAFALRMRFLYRVLAFAVILLNLLLLRVVAWGGEGEIKEALDSRLEGGKMIQRFEDQRHCNDQGSGDGEQ